MPATESSRPFPVYQPKTSPPPQQQTGKKTFYTHTRGDRPGSAILDMLMAHAYSFQRGAVYGGACGTTPFSTLPNQQLLIAVLGLSSELPFACPKPTDQNNFILEFAQYYNTSITSQIFTPQWFDYIASKTRPQKQKPDHNHCQMAVHVRRGDVSLCGVYFKRYLPNKYYLELIDEYLPLLLRQQRRRRRRDDNRTTCNVTIYSNLVDPKAHNAHEYKEPWTDFSAKGFSLQLGSDLGETWESMMTATVLILSKSSFSFVPAMFNTIGTVVYTPFWMEPIPRWNILSLAHRDWARQLTQQLRKQHCNFPSVRLPKTA